MIIEVAPYNYLWPKLYEAEAEKIRHALKEDCLSIYHIGSTSIEGLSAKPIIDILAVTKDISAINSYNSAMKDVDHEAKGEYCKLKGIKVVKLHANLKAEGFYRKLGYDNMTFNDPSISKETVDLGKIL